MATSQHICLCRQGSAANVSGSTKQVACLSRGHKSAAAGWVLPSLGLVLVPKCPMCIAAWLALGGGLGVSFTAASYLRTGFVWLCWLFLALMVLRLMMRFSAKTRSALGVR